MHELNIANKDANKIPIESYLISLAIMQYIIIIL